MVPTDNSEGIVEHWPCLFGGVAQVMGTQAICPEPNSRGRGKGTNTDHLLGTLHVYNGNNNTTNNG